MSQGFTKSKMDSNLYLKVEGIKLVMLILYVDDMFLTDPRHVHLTTAKHMSGLVFVRYINDPII